MAIALAGKTDKVFEPPSDEIVEGPDLTAMSPAGVHKNDTGLSRSSMPVN
jgi:hypothetical protein